MTPIELIEALNTIKLSQLTDDELTLLYRAGEGVCCDIETEWADRDDPEPEPQRNLPRMG